MRTIGLERTGLLVNRGERDPRGGSDLVVVDSWRVPVDLVPGSQAALYPPEHPEWLAQADWAIDPTNGSDANRGNAAAPLRTLGEYARRIGAGTVTAAVHTIQILGHLTEPYYVLNGAYPNGAIIRGQKTTIREGGRFTAVQNWNSAASPGVDGLVTDGTLPVSFAASGCLGRLVELASGAQTGAIGTIAKETAAKTARVLFWNAGSFARVNPGVNDFYRVYSVTRIEGPFLHNARGPAGVQYQDLEFPEVGGFDGLVCGNGPVFFLNCILGAIHTRLQVTNDVVVVTGCLVNIPGATLQVWQGELDFYGSTIACTIRGATPGAYIAIAGSSMAQTGLVAGEAQLEAREGSLIEVAANADFAAFDGGAGAAMNVLQGTGRLRNGAKVWGLGWTGGYGISVDSGGKMLYPTGDNLTAHADVRGAGLVADVHAGAVTRTYAGVGVAGYVDLTANLMTGAITGTGAMVVPARFAA